MTCVDRGFLVFGAYCISFGCGCKRGGGGVSEGVGAHVGRACPRGRALENLVSRSGGLLEDVAGDERREGLARRTPVQALERTVVEQMVDPTVEELLTPIVASMPSEEKLPANLEDFE